MKRGDSLNFYRWYNILYSLVHDEFRRENNKNIKTHGRYKSDVLCRVQEKNETNSTNINRHQIIIQYNCGRRTIPSGNVSTKTSPTIDCMPRTLILFFGGDTWPRVKGAASKGTFGESRVKSFAIVVNKDKSLRSIQRYLYIYIILRLSLRNVSSVYNRSSENLSWRIVRNL